MYLVLEIQKINDQISTLTYSYEDQKEAESKYFTILAAAAISNIEQHAASLLTDKGQCLMNRSYTHEAEA